MKMITLIDLKPLATKFPLLLTVCKMSAWYIGILFFAGILNGAVNSVPTGYVTMMGMLALLFVFRGELRWSLSSPLFHWGLIALLLVFYVFGLMVAGSTFVSSSIPLVLERIGDIAIKATWEEVVFRGVLFARFILGLRWQNIVVLILVSSLYFGLPHLRETMYPFLYVLITVVMGSVLCLVYLLTRNLVFTAVLHTLINMANGVFRLPLGAGAYFVIYGIQALMIVALIAILFRSRTRQVDVKRKLI